MSGTAEKPVCQTCHGDGFINTHANVPDSRCPDCGGGVAMGGHTATDEQWARALECAMSCLHGIPITAAELDNAMQHAFGMLSLHKASAVTDSHADLVKALEKIEKWFGEFPETGMFWDKDKTTPMSYAAAFGSHGERDFMREIARTALATLTARKVG